MTVACQNAGDRREPIGEAPDHDRFQRPVSRRHRGGPRPGSPVRARLGAAGCLGGRQRRRRDHGRRRYRRLGRRRGRGRDRGSGWPRRREPRVGRHRGRWAGDHRSRPFGIRTGRCGGEQRGNLPNAAVRGALGGRLVSYAAGAPRRRVLPRATCVPRHEIAELRPLRDDRVISRLVRTAARVALRRGEGGCVRADECDRGRGRRARDRRERSPTVRPVSHGVGDARRPVGRRRRRVVHRRDPAGTGRADGDVLASRACAFSHHNYSAGAGRFARVFVGLGEGWLAPRDAEPTAEDVQAHLEEVSATANFTVPMSIVDEVVSICSRLGISL